MLCNYFEKLGICLERIKKEFEKANTESCLLLPKLIGPCFNHVRVIYLNDMYKSAKK